MGNVKTAPWDIFEVLKTEEEVRAFVEASIEEARNDTDPRLLAHALATAAEARRRLAEKDAAPMPCAELKGDPSIVDFDKTVRLFRYHVTLSPVT